TLLGTTLAPAHVLGYRGDDTKGGNHAQAILTDENPTLTVEKEVLTDENPILTDEKNFLTAEKNFLANEKEILTDENSILTGEKATGLKPIQGKASTTPKIIDKDLLDPLDQEELERDEDLNPSELKEKARLASSLQEFKESIGSYAFLKFISYVKAEHPSVKNLDAYLFKAWKDLVQGWVDTLPMIVQPPRPSLDELKRLYPKSWQKAAKHFGY
ncbi:MAG: hypothetical protein IE914_04505, partial [Thiotrichales bacterium]|nr:hypothetical protein [Thiotrichales bacterium]